MIKVLENWIDDSLENLNDERLIISVEINVKDERFLEKLIEDKNYSEINESNDEVRMFVKDDVFVIVDVKNSLSDRELIELMKENDEVNKNYDVIYVKVS